METKNDNNKPVVQSTKVTLDMPSLDQLGELDGMDKVYKRTASYRTQEDWFAYKDKPVRCYYLGVKELPNDKGEIVLSGIFAAKDGIFLAAQRVIIDAVRDLPSNTPLEITFLGKKKNKTSDGSTNIFEVIVLGGVK
jgi:hypothetical protein